MKIIKPTVELMKHDTNLYPFIERVGRVCYKSEDKIAEGTAKKFVTQLAKNGHRGILEHEYLYLKFENYNDIIHFISSCWIPDSHSYNIHKYLNISEEYISGSVRAWIEYFNEVHKLSQKYLIGQAIYECIHYLLNSQYPDLFPLLEGWGYTDDEGRPMGKISLVDRESFINEKKSNRVYFNLLPHTLKFTIDRGLSHEFVRHRPASFAQSSTRYCDYSSNKHGAEITVIEPCFLSKEEEAYASWKKACEEAEADYMYMKNVCGCKPEEARSVLPNSLMTELIITATESEWQHIINLRYHGTTGRPHPQMEEVMEMAYPILVKESEGRIK